MSSSAMGGPRILRLPLTVTHKINTFGVLRFNQKFRILSRVSTHRKNFQTSPSADPQLRCQAALSIESTSHGTTPIFDQMVHNKRTWRQKRGFADRVS